VESFDQPADYLRIDITFIRTAGNARDRAAHFDMMFFCRGNDRLKTLKTFFNRAVDIGLAKLFSGRTKNRNDIHPGFECIVKTPHIRHKRAIFHTRFRHDPLRDLVRALHGRNDLGTHELSHLNSGKPGSGEPIDQLNPKVYRDQMLKAFQAISGGQIDDFDFAGECHGLASIPSQLDKAYHISYALENTDCHRGYHYGEQNRK